MTGRYNIFETIYLALKDIFKKHPWDKKGINIDGRYLNHLYFTDNILLINIDLKQLEEMLIDLNAVSEGGFKINVGKIKVMTLEQTIIKVKNKIIDKVEDYIYLDHIIRKITIQGKSNEMAEIVKRIQMEKLGFILIDRSILINLKRKFLHVSFRL